MEYLLVKWTHILSSTLLFGTGIGSAFYLLTAVMSQKPRVVSHVARWVVRADWLFTATTAVIQPLTGWWLVKTMGLPLSTPWVFWSAVLYAVAIACWLPVTWLQAKMRDSAESAESSHLPLPRAFWIFFWWWFALGIPALAAFLAIFWLMVAKPVAI